MSLKEGTLCILSPREIALLLYKAFITQKSKLVVTQNSTSLLPSTTLTYHRRTDESKGSEEWGGVGGGDAVLRENVSAAPLWRCISKSPPFHYDTHHNSLDNISQFISLVIFKISVGNHIHLNFSRVVFIIILLFAQSSERICVFKRCMRHSASPADKETTQPMTNSAS